MFWDRFHGDRFGWCNAWNVNLWNWSFGTWRCASWWSRAPAVSPPHIGRGRRRGCLGFGFKNFGPIELDIGVVLFDPADRILVQCGPPDLDAWRCPKPIENALSRPPVAAAGMDERRCFVPALIAGKPQKWQSYLRLDERAGFFTTFFFEPVGRAVPLLDAAFDFGFGAAFTGRDEGRPSDGALYAGRKRISSPIQW